jgi:hypothetical protein
MIYVVSMLTVSALLASAIAVIVATLRGHGDAVVAALAGRSVRAQSLFVPGPRVRVTTVRPATIRTRSPLRAAA